MKHMKSIRTALAGAAMLGLAAGASAPAEAAFIFNMVDNGGNVEVTGSGSINLAGLAFLGVGGAGTTINPSTGYLVLGGSALYRGFTGPLSFGPGGRSLMQASSRTGSLVGIASDVNVILVPGNYVSGTFISNSGRFSGATIASLGATPGTYVWNWGSGPNADSLTLNIGPIAVPEPASFALFGAGLIGLAALRRRKPTPSNA